LAADVVEGDPLAEQGWDAEHDGGGDLDRLEEDAVGEGVAGVDAVGSEDGDRGAAAAVLLAVNVTAVVPVTPSNIGIFQAAPCPGG